MSPVDDTFLSGSLDNTVMAWDLRAQTPQGKIDVKGKPVVAFDPKGVCFAVGCAINLIKMYDRRKYDAGPFTQFPLRSQKTIEFSNMKISPQGKYISVMTSDSLLLMDAFKGDQLAEFVDFESGTVNLEASFTPDEQYLFCGSENGAIHFWNTRERTKVAELQGHAGPVRCVQFNPFYTMMASGCTNLAMWIPVSSSSTRN